MKTGSLLRRGVLVRLGVVGVWVALLAQGFLPVTGGGAVAPAAVPQAPNAATGQRQGTAVEGQEDESDELAERAERAHRRLAYPGTSYPGGWRSDALAHVTRHVRDGLDFRRTTSGAGTDAAAAVPAGSWKALGPNPINGATQPVHYRYGLVSGRINALAFHPTDPKIAYAGAAAGGLWKTTNCCSASTVWVPLWEDKDFITQAVGAIEIDPGDPRVIYVGTGDPAGDQHGEGIMKSTDGGATWAHLGGATFKPFAHPWASVPDQNITAIEVDPKNRNTVVVGTRNGLFISYNAGGSWVRRNIHAHAGMSQHVSSILIESITGQPRSTLFVAVGHPRPDGYGGGNGVYRGLVPLASAADPILVRKVSGFPAGTGNGTPNSVGRIRLAGWRDGTGKLATIYAQVGDLDNRNALGTYRTRNSGDTWVLLANSGDTSYRDCASQPTNERQDWYDLTFAVDPANDKQLYIGRTSFYKATVAGDYNSLGPITDLTTVYSLSCSAYGSVHPDNHAFAFVPGTNGQQFLLGNDGGVYHTTNRGAAGSWKPLQNGLNITQFYAGQLGQNFATGTTQWAFGGSQDNGSPSWDSSQPDGTWQARSTGGDGFFAAFDPIGGTATAGNWYTEYTYGQLDCSTAGVSAPFTGACLGPWYTSTGDQIDRTDWSTPFVLDQVNCRSTGCRNMALGTYRVWASGQGGPRASWVDVSNDLTKASGAGARHTIIDLRIAASNPRAVVVGTDDGNVAWSESVFTGATCTKARVGAADFACTPNTGAKTTWAKFVGGGASLLPNRAMSGVAFDPTNHKTIYVAVGGFNANTPGKAGHVFRGNCALATGCANPANWTWQNKTGNLPDVPAETVLANPKNAKQVFVGTHFGFYYTNDITVATPVWHRFQTGLPNTVVKYLTVDRGNTTLGAFTYGRGLFVTQLPAAAVPANACNAFEPNDTAGQAKQIGVGTAETHTFCALNDQDWVKFTAAKDATYRFETLTLANGVDTVMELYSTNGTTLITSDAASTARPSLLSHKFPAAGTYYLRLRNKSGAGAATNRYDLRITLISTAAPTVNRCTLDEPNQYRPEAKPFALGSTKQLGFCEKSDVDWFWYDAQPGYGYLITANNLAPDVDIVLRCFDSTSETPFWTQDEGFAGEAEAAYCYTTGSTPFRVYLQVYDYEWPDAFGPDNRYDLKIVRTAMPPPSSAGGDAKAGGSRPAPGGSIGTSGATGRGVGASRT